MLSKDVKKEIIKMLVGILVLTAVMLIIFACFGYFDIPTILGGLFGGFVAFVNFVLLALAIERSLSGFGNAKATLASSYVLRLIIIGIAVVFAIKSSYLNYLSAVIPLIFPRIIIMAINLSKKSEEK